MSQKNRTWKEEEFWKTEEVLSPKRAEAHQLTRDIFRKCQGGEEGALDAWSGIKNARGRGEI